jgi:hypothetical protein
MAKDTAVHTVYRVADGTRVPSVTTYLGILGKPALIDWAWQLGVQGLDYKKVRDQSGDTGTLVHYLVLCYLTKQEPSLEDYTQGEISTSILPMSKFDDWKQQHELAPVLTETPLVSESYRYGGTPDFYGTVDGKLTLLDFKTSGAIYPENFYQLAAYKQLLEEAGHTVDEVAILRIGKSAEEGFEYRQAGNLDIAFKIFLACQQIYELQKESRRIK